MTSQTLAVISPDVSPALGTTAPHLFVKLPVPGVLLPVTQVGPVAVSGDLDVTARVVARTGALFIDLTLTLELEGTMTSQDGTEYKVDTGHSQIVLPLALQKTVFHGSFKNQPRWKEQVRRIEEILRVEPGDLSIEDTDFASLDARVQVLTGNIEKLYAIAPYKKYHRKKSEFVDPALSLGLEEDDALEVVRHSLGVAGPVAKLGKLAELLCVEHAVNVEVNAFMDKLHAALQ
jgi:hypothetical protein